jgi:hypothetical protein
MLLRLVVRLGAANDNNMVDAVSPGQNGPHGTPGRPGNPLRWPQPLSRFVLAFARSNHSDTGHHAGALQSSRIRSAQRISSSSLRHFPGIGCLSTRSLGYSGEELFQVLLHDPRHSVDVLTLVLALQGGKVVVGHEGLARLILVHDEVQGSI